MGSGQLSMYCMYVLYREKMLKGKKAAALLPCRVQETVSKCHSLRSRSSRYFVIDFQ